MHTSLQVYDSLRKIQDLEALSQALIRLGVISSKTIGLDSKETLSIAMEAKAKGIGIPSDIKSKKEWFSLNKNIKISPDVKMLHTSKIMIDDNGAEVAVPDKRLIDISQIENARDLGIVPIHQDLPSFTQETYDTLIENIQKAELININEALSTAYMVHIKTIDIDASEPIDTRIEAIIKAICDYEATGEKEKSFTLKENEKSFYDTVTAVTAHALLNRLGIKSTLPINLQQVQYNIGSIIEQSDKLIKKVSSSLELDKAIVKTLHASNPQAIQAHTNNINNKYNTKPKKEFVKDPNFPEFQKLTEQEMKELSEKVDEEIKSTDPQPILDAIRIPYVPTNGKYKITQLGNEDTKTTHVLTDGSNWYFNRFGNGGQGGSIIKLAELHAGLDFKEAKELCRATLNIPDYFQEALDLRRSEYEIAKDNYFKSKGRRKEKQKDYSGVTKGSQNPPTSHSGSQKKSSIEDILAKADKNISNLQVVNKQIAQESATSRIVAVSKNINPSLTAMLNDRKIQKFPKELLEITIERKGFNDDGSQYMYQETGAGVLYGSQKTIDKVNAFLEKHPAISLNQDWDSVTLGADIHFARTPQELAKGKPKCKSGGARKQEEHIVEYFELEDGKKVQIHQGTKEISLPNGMIAKIQRDTDNKPYYLNSQNQKVFAKQEEKEAINSYTFVNNGGAESKKLALFESKNDYFAAYQEIDFQKEQTDIIIANSTGQAKSVNELIKEKNYTNVTNYIQCDYAALEFTKKAFEGYTHPLTSLTYNQEEYSYDPSTKKEDGWDPNDIIKNDRGLNAMHKRAVQYTGVKQSLKPLIEMIEEKLESITPQNQEQTDDIENGLNKIHKLKSEIGLTQTSQAILGLG